MFRIVEYFILNFQIKEETIEKKQRMNSSDSIERPPRHLSSASPVEELENQITFYERVKNSFFLELDKTSSNNNPDSKQQSQQQQQQQQLQSQLSPINPMLLQKRHSTTYEQKFFAAALGMNPNVLLNQSDNDESDIPMQPIAQQLLDLHDYTGDVVGGSPLPQSKGGNNLNEPNKFFSSRSSSRSSSISLPTSSKKSLDEDPFGDSTARKQLSVDSINGTSSAMNNCLVPIIVVHETKPTLKDQVN